jgi:hypothetical protein
MITPLVSALTATLPTLTTVCALPFVLVKTAILNFLYKTALVRIIIFILCVKN